jgi:CRISPR/Cas system CSM-associated protein Csm2 small subunit
MTGEPHDQLHVVLVPMLDEISIMRESKNDKESENALINLKDLIQAYYEYFKP